MPVLRHHAQFSSRFLPDARDVAVYLPPRYETDAAQRFPVLYLHDGQNLFDGEQAYIKGESWRAGERADAAIAAGRATPLIIVGVYNTGTRRTAEYTPTRTRRLGGGLADAYGRLLVEELKPFIDKTYRTEPTALHTGLGGSSLGGLVTLHLGLEHPGVFGRLAVMSPSVWWDRRVILREVRRARPKPDLRIWLDIGLAEGKKAVSDVRLLRAGLVESGWNEGADLAYSEHRDARHAESAWGARFADMLGWLFPA